VHRLFGFPNPVNELAARTVAAGVVVMALTAVLTRQLWLCLPIAYGFVARVATGPKLSPLGQLATRVVAPRLGEARPTPGPPKRFAQAMGAAFSCSALGLWLSGHSFAAVVVLGFLAVPALLEAALGLCVGCQLFGLAMHLGLIPRTVCEECEDIWSRARLTTSGRA
jgi:hypothetical protein